MSAVAPPPVPPVVALEDFDRRRFRMRVTKLVATVVTLLVSAWLFTLGETWLLGILGLLVAKHVLIAIFLMGSGIHDPRLAPPPSQTEGSSPQP